LDVFRDLPQAGVGTSKQARKQSKSQFPVYSFQGCMDHAKSISILACAAARYLADMAFSRISILKAPMETLQGLTDEPTD
jgi:hypothetical protein